MQPKPAFNPEEKRILLVTCTCHFLSHMMILVFPAVTMPLVFSLGIPLEEVVKLSFFMYLFYGLSALPVGLIVDRWQARKMLLFGLAGMGSGLIIAGVFQSARTIALALILVGIGASVYHPAGLSLISHTVERRGRALAINGVFGNLGIAAAPLVTGILTWFLSWERAFVILGAGSIFASIILSPLPINERLRPQGKGKGNSGKGHLKYFLVLCFALVLGGFCYRGNMVLLPAYLELKTTFFLKLITSFSSIKIQGTKTLAATLLSSLVMLTGIFGQMMGGRLADRYDLRRAYLFVHLMSVPFLLAMALTENIFLSIAAAMYVFFSLGMQPIENSLIAALTPAKWRSTSYAVKFILNFGIGSSVLYLIGPIKRAYSLEVVYLFLSGVAGLLVLSIVGLIIASRRIGAMKNY